MFEKIIEKNYFSDERELLALLQRCNVKQLDCLDILKSVNTNSMDKKQQNSYNDNRSSSDEEDEEEKKRREVFMRAITEPSTRKVVGLEKPKLLLESAIGGPQDHKEHQEKFLSHSIRDCFLLYGCPGVGKSCLADYAAKKGGMKIMKISGALLTGKKR